MWWANIVTVVLCLSISVANFWNLSLPTTYYHSPLVVADNNQTEEPVTVTFVGDLLLARHVENLMMQHGTDYPFLGQNLSSSTYVFANFESVVPRQHEKTKVRSIKFSTPKWAVQALLDAGFTHLSLANNHSFDFGQSGLSNTKQILKQNNLSYFGHPHEINTSSTEYINFSTSTVAVTGINFLNTSLSKESISYLESLEANSDYQIAFVHWGEEYNPTAGLT